MNNSNQISSENVSHLKIGQISKQEGMHRLNSTEVHRPNFQNTKECTASTKFQNKKECNKEEGISKQESRIPFPQAVIDYGHKSNTSYYTRNTFVYHKRHIRI